MSGDDVENIYITLNAKSLDPTIRVVARASSQALVKKYQRAGVDHILLPNENASIMMSVAILRPTMYKAIHAIFTGQNVALLDEVKVYEHSVLNGRRVEEIDFRAYKLLLIGVQKAEGDRFVFNPDGDLLLEKGDILLVMGHKMSIAYFRESSCGVKGGCPR
jgi:voltage-gated potassium channel